MQMVSETSTSISRGTNEKNDLNKKLSVLQKEASDSNIEYKKQQASIASIEKEVAQLEVYFWYS